MTAVDGAEASRRICLRTSKTLQLVCNGKLEYEGPPRLAKKLATFSDRSESSFLDGDLRLSHAQSGSTSLAVSHAISRRLLRMFGYAARS